MRKISNTIVLILLTKVVFAQHVVRDTLYFEEASVEGKKERVTGQKLSDSKRLLFDWAIQPLSEISYKTYGPSGVGSLSYRNLPASQIQMIWNGISISSPLLGQADINQVPITAAWQTTLQTSSQSGLVAGGTTASSITVQSSSLMADSVTTGIGFKGQVGVGTYGFMQSQASIESRFDAWALSVRYFHQQAENDFSIYRSATADPSLPKVQVNAAAFNRQGEVQLRFGSEEQAYSSKLTYLLNQSQRELPPPITKYFSSEGLKTNLNAFSFQQNWRLNPSLKYTSTLGLVQDNSLYRYENGVSTSPYASQTIQLNGHLEQTFVSQSGYLQTLKVSHSSSWAHPTAGAYPSSSQNAHTFSGLASLLICRVKVIPKAFIFLYHGQIQTRPGGSILRRFLSTRFAYGVEMSTQPLYRPPTLNDLYYPGSGNSNLKPETGRLYEAEFSLKARSIRPLAWEAQVTPFVYLYQSFIAWLPEGNIWRPHQRQKAQVSGGTLLGMLTITKSQSSYRLRQQLTYSQGGYGGDVFTFRQRPISFIYAPNLRFTSSIVYESPHFLVEVQASYTSARLTDSEASQPQLPGFMIYTLKLDWHNIPLTAGKLSASAQASIASRPDYGFIANYAAPRAWGNLTLSYQFNYAQ